MNRITEIFPTSIPENAPVTFVDITYFPKEPVINWTGSTNQRAIDAKESLEVGRVVLERA